jgi:hypothetical protein
MSEQSINLPPSPPSLETKKKMNPGKFPYIKEIHTREMLENAYQAITLTETWDFVKGDIESFQMSNDNRIWVITDKMKELGYDNHSGYSFGYTMRQMQNLARYGPEKFMNNFINSNYNEKQ